MILNKDGLAEIYARKLLDLEIEHARLELELRLARATNIQNEAVANAENQMRVLNDQLDILQVWLAPQPEEPTPVTVNGQGPED